MRKNIKGITLVSLVVTIIVLLILAGVSIYLVGNGGIIKQAQNAAKLSKLASIKEQISMDILAGEMESKANGEEFNKDQLNEIINKYGELQEDGDTIKTNDGDISLKEILEGNDEIPEDYKKKFAELQKELEDKNKKISELEENVDSLNSQVTNLTEFQAKGTANEGQVLTGYTFSNSNGVNLSGTMPNRGTLNWSGNNTTYSVPAGYYSGGTLDSRASYNAGVAAAGINIGSPKKSGTVMGTYMEYQPGSFTISPRCCMELYDLFSHCKFKICGMYAILSNKCYRRIQGYCKCH